MNALASTTPLLSLHIASASRKCDNVFWTTDHKTPVVARSHFGGNAKHGNRMDCSTRSLSAFVVSEDGQDLVEYGLVAALIALVGLLSFTTFSGSLTTKIVNEFNTLGSYL
jgi:Flp pilus assembly pilin Flp